MINIILNRRDFEYDVYSLVKSFYPTEDVHTFSTEEEAAAALAADAEADKKDAGAQAEDTQVHKISVFYENNLFTVTDELPDEEAVSDTEAVGETGENDRKAEKDAIKTVLYRLLCKRTGEELPWGNLTGIRPTKIAMSLLEEGKEEEQIAQEMEERYFVSPQKSHLAAQIAQREHRILDGISYDNGYSVYVGIPFCPSICLYCSFSSSPLAIWKKKVDEYLDALCHEIDEACDTFAGKELNTIYIGGGTPTTLEPEQMDRLLTKLEEKFDLSKLREFTVEAGRPDSITREKLQVLRDHGIDRISINPQTMNQKTLDLIGRHHTVDQIRESFLLAREMGFDNINMDLIVGLPGEDMDEVRYTMDEISKLDPDDITVHSLALKRGTRLHLLKEQFQDISFKNSSAIMDMTAERCLENGLTPYYLYRQKNMAGNFENVGYARPGKAGLYNILIMEEVQSILAFGAGASTKIVYSPDHIERVENVKDIKNYIERIDEMIERKRKIHG